MRADIKPIFDLAGVLCRSCALSLPRLAHQHIGQSDAIDVRLLPGQSRIEPLHHGLVHAHRVVLRPAGNVGHACPTIGALAKHPAMRHSILRILRDAGGARAQRVPIKFSALASSFALPITDERSARTNSIACMTLVWSPESIHDLI